MKLIRFLFVLSLLSLRPSLLSADERRTLIDGLRSAIKNSVQSIYAPREALFLGSLDEDETATDPLVSWLVRLSSGDASGGTSLRYCSINFVGTGDPGSEKWSMLSHFGLNDPSGPRVLLITRNHEASPQPLAIITAVLEQREGEEKEVIAVAVCFKFENGKWIETDPAATKRVTESSKIPSGD